jgi:hypothetical protein
MCWKRLQIEQSRKNFAGIRCPFPHRPERPFLSDQVRNPNPSFFVLVRPNETPPVGREAALDAGFRDRVFAELLGSAGQTTI